MKNELSSFRDPAGYLFWQDEILYRTITKKYIDTYQVIKRAGFYKNMISEGKIVPFREHPANVVPCCPKDTPLLLEPEIIPFISYPYEWSFSQLKDAALLTLDLHLAGLEQRFLLKDASAYNIQFRNGKPIFIDHLSFEACDKHPIWPAYGQFCRHFLAPLTLMSKVDPELNTLLKIYIDGIPLPLARKLIPTRKSLSFGLLVHLIGHASSQKKYADNTEVIKTGRKLSPNQMRNIALSLKETVKKLTWHPNKTEWSAYYDGTNYSDIAMQSKIDIIDNFVQKVTGTKTVWDFGGNIGLMSRAIQKHAERIVCFDSDIAAVEQNYLQVKLRDETKILPLVMDFTNPSPAIGFASQERYSLSSRGKADLGLALALIHHLAISNNTPLHMIAKYFSSLCKSLIIEFVPKHDSQVQRLLHSRNDIFDEYSSDHFQKAFSTYFDIIAQKPVTDSKRTLFLMKKKIT